MPITKAKRRTDRHVRATIAARAVHGPAVVAAHPLAGMRIAAGQVATALGAIVDADRVPVETVPGTVVRTTATAVPTDMVKTHARLAKRPARRRRN